jgi:hypothetical protein
MVFFLRAGMSSTLADGCKKQSAYACWNLYTCLYNFVGMHKTLKCSPAMAAGISKTLWSLQDVVAAMDARTRSGRKRGSYKPRQAKVTS